MKSFFAYTAIILLLAGCSHDDDDTGETADKKSPPKYMLYSPNGEPLNGGPLGKPTCEQALGGWFDRMSAGSTSISKSAFLADAQAQFTRMDIDHNGYIVSEELDRFRAPYRQEAPAGFSEAADKPSKSHGKHKGKEVHEGSHSDPSLSMADPVMSADTNLDFKVTPDEFTKQAQDVFARLDNNHDGALSRAETLAFCTPPKKP